MTHVSIVRLTEYTQHTHHFASKRDRPHPGGPSSSNGGSGPADNT